MKGLAYLTVIVLIFGTLASCSESPIIDPTRTPTAISPSSTPTQPPSNTVDMIEPVHMIEPGDMIGEMVFRQAVDKSEMPPLLGDICGWVKLELAEVSEEKTEVCNTVYYPTIFLSLGMTDPDPDKLNKYWQNVTWEISINGQLLDHEAFGTIDALGGRWWNVLLENPISDPLQMVTMVTVQEDPIEKYGMTLNMMVGAAEGESLIRQEVPYVLSASDVKAGQHAYYSEMANLDYLLFVPGHYWANPEQQWAVILYLHESDSGNNINSLRRYGLSKKLENESNFPFLVVSPLIIDKHEFWRKEETIVAVDALMEEIEANLNVDPKRIYLTGESTGENGTWAVGLRNPDRYAALVPVAGSNDHPFTVPDNICELKEVPIWVFFGDKNEALPLDAEQQIVETLEKCGGIVELTVYPEVGHDIEELVYENSNLYTWLLSKTQE